MAKKQTGTVTLTLTPEEANLVELLLFGEKLELTQIITGGDVWPGSATITAAAQEAREKLPMVEALCSRVARICFDAKLSSYQEGRPQ